MGFSLVVVCGFSLSNCGMQAPECMGVGSVVVARAPEHMGSVVCDMQAL